MAPNPKLVEALAVEFLGVLLDEPESADAGHMIWALQKATEFLARHRLVQLPGWPNGEAGELERDPDGQPAYQHFIGQAVPIPDPGTPVYILPGDPKEVDDG